MSRRHARTRNHFAAVLFRALFVARELGDSVTNGSPRSDDQQRGEDREGRQVGVPTPVRGCNRRLERRIAVVVVEPAAKHRAQEDGREKRAIDRKAERRGQIEPRAGSRSRHPDQREGDHHDPAIAEHLPDDMEARVRCPGRVGRVRLIEVGHDGKRAVAERRNGQQDARDQIAVAGEFHDVPPHRLIKIAFGESGRGFCVRAIPPARP